MSKLKYWILAGVLVSLCGCGSADQAEPAKSDTDAPVKEEGVFDPMVGTMDRAKAVEGAGMSRKDEMDQRLEEAQ